MNFLDFISIDKSQINKIKVHFATTAPDGSNPLNEFFSGSFQDWQSNQARDNFNRDYVLSFISYRNCDWLFAGFFKKNKYTWLKKENHCEYDLTQTDVGSEFIGRAIIFYNKPFRQPYPNCETCADGLNLVEIIRDVLRIKDFEGYEKTLINFSTLQSIIKSQDRSWKTALSSVKGVYLITDQKTGKHYIGSAYGDNNLWQRWSNYAQTRHGGNKKLIDLISINKDDYANNFMFSILEVMKNTVDKDYVIKREGFWKSALMTREYGLNDN